ncbi:2-oxoadipate dioxygenase/decarboxylase family protein [Vibrio brasiliensis]
MTPDVLFQQLWNDYIQRLCPSAEKVHQLLQEDEALINDHIALRTFNVEPLGIATLAQPFLDAGYKPCGDYVFESKKLAAKHFEHPDPKQPKVFISELKVDECSSELQAIVAKLVEQVDTDKLKGHEFLHGGRLWDISHADYQTLAKESEYAAWLAAHGYGANHFTVSVNQLNAFDEVKGVNDHLRSAGFTINEFGGEVKGTPEVLLEQSSTMADKVPVQFTEGSEIIPGGFYEFAKRYPMSNGELYPGFVAASADKIFESTNG